MPIPREKLLETQKPLEERILQFLDSRQDDAFTLPEILVGIGDFDPTTLAMTIVASNSAGMDNLLRPYLVALENLKTSGTIMAAEWKGSTHYAVKTPRKRL